MAGGIFINDEILQEFKDVIGNENAKIQEV